MNKKTRTEIGRELSGFCQINKALGSEFAITALAIFGLVFGISFGFQMHVFPYSPVGMWIILNSTGCALSVVAFYYIVYCTGMLSLFKIAKRTFLL